VKIKIKTKRKRVSTSVSIIRLVKNDSYLKAGPERVEQRKIQPMKIRMPPAPTRRTRTRQPVAPITLKSQTRIKRKRGERDSGKKGR
jgi:hypothetical protein